MEAKSDLRNSIKEYINNADVRFLKMIKALAETYHSEEKADFLEEEDYREIDTRRSAHLKGESESFTWNQVKKNARSAAE